MIFQKKKQQKIYSKKREKPKILNVFLIYANFNLMSTYTDILYSKY